MVPTLDLGRPGRLRVSTLHELHFEEWGNAGGIPVVYLHGGPGEGCHARQSRFFNLDRYRVILLDQRGCGRSTPHACTEENTTSELVSDIEKLRDHLGIDRWLVFGGSWGSTLALAYAQTYPASVSAMVLWGIFLGRQREVRWYYQDGARNLFPEAWKNLAAAVPPEERQDLVSGFHRILNSGDPHARSRAAVAWSQWEATTMNLKADSTRVNSFGEARFADAFARLETHYFANDCFLRDTELLEGVPRLRHIPTRMIHGRYDVVTPVSTAVEMKERWPEADLFIVADAGHSSTEPGIEAQLVKAAADFDGQRFIRKAATLKRWGRA